MRVVMNVTSMAGNKTGIGHYTTELLKALRATGEVEVSEFPHPLLSKLRTALGGGPKPTIPRPAVTSPASGAKPAASTTTPKLKKTRAPLRFAWRFVNSVYSTTQFTRKRYDLYHEPNFVPLPGRLPSVVTIHDLSPVLYPQWHPAERIHYFERHFTPNIRRMSHILAVSEFARREIIATLGIPADRVTRTYNGVREHLAPLAPEETARTLRELGLPPRYLLHVGTIEPRKNLDMLLRTYCGLPAELRESCPLVLVGSWGWRMEATAEYYEAEARHKNVIRPGYLPDHALAAVYNGARALLFPTLYEGFGMPAAEMLACGGAVISSTAGAVAEVLGPCGHQIDPHDVDGWRAALVRIITDDDWREQLRQGGPEQAAQFTWAACARDTLKAYRQTIAGDRARRSPNGRA